jgi:hypothetical protein
MNILSPSEVRTVVDYDVVLDSGLVEPFTIDEKAGDTFERNELEIRVHQSARPSMTNPDRNLPAQDTVIFVSKVASIKQRVREVVQMTEEERGQWKKLIAEMANPTVQ